MLIRVGCEVAFTCPRPAAMVLMLYLHPSRLPTIKKPERLESEPCLAISEYTDCYGNHCGRVVVPAGRVLFRNDAIVDDCGLSDLQVPNAPQKNVQDLPHEVLLFLLASRYCEVDSELKDLSWKLFGRFQPGWPRVQAICNFVQQHIRFDYMHLAITFCRALNIPARYCTGYLGDIGVPAAPYAMDVSAWFEAHLGGQW